MQQQNAIKVLTIITIIPHICHNDITIKDFSLVITDIFHNEIGNEILMKHIEGKSTNHYRNML